MSWWGDGVRWLLKQDSYMYTAGYDDEGEGCRSTQNEFMYVGVRCGDQQDNTGWMWPDVPCKFKVRPEHTATSWAHADAASSARGRTASSACGCICSVQCVWLRLSSA